MAPCRKRKYQYTSNRKRSGIELSKIGFGDFYRLPSEMIMQLLDRSDYGTLAKLSCSSKTMHIFVGKYVFGSMGMNRFLADADEWLSQCNCVDCLVVHVDYRDVFAAWGQLMKLITCVLPTRCRLDKIEQFYEQVSSFVNKWEFGENRYAVGRILRFEDGRPLDRLNRLLIDIRGPLIQCTV